MELFQIIDGELIVSIHALMIDPFKTIWEKEDDMDKPRAKIIFKYIELTCNPKKSNPFAGYPETQRPTKVKKHLFGDENPNIDEEMRSDIVYGSIEYKELLKNASPSYGLYVDAMFAVDKLRAFFRTFDFDERTNSGGMVLKPRDIASALGELEEVDKNIVKARDKVHGELVDNVKTRNQREIGYFER